MPKIYSRREAKRRRMRFEVFAGMFDFLTFVAGLAVIAACLVLLTSLVKWVRADVETSFATLWNIFTSAIIIPQ